MPINIDMGDDWVITSDSANFVLNKRKSKKGGDVYLDAEGYYYSLDALLRSFFLQKLRSSRAKSFDDLAKLVVKFTDEINAIGNIFREAIKNYKPEEVPSGTEDQTSE